jgi:hypothetical protein
MLRLKFFLSSNKQEILFGFDYPAEGGMVCTNQQMLDK